MASFRGCHFPNIPTLGNLLVVLIGDRSFLSVKFDSLQKKLKMKINFKMRFEKEENQNSIISFCLPYKHLEMTVKHVLWIIKFYIQTHLYGKQCHWAFESHKNTYCQVKLSFPMNSFFPSIAINSFECFDCCCDNIPRRFFILFLSGNRGANYLPISSIK